MDKRLTRDQRDLSKTDDFESAVRAGVAEADAGKVISYEKIRRWLLSWGSDKELPPPK